MNKSILLLAIFATVAFSQAPIPIPGVNTEYLSGVWWAQWQYLSNSTLNQSLFSCSSYTLTVENSTINAIWDYTYNGTKETKNLTYTLSTPSSWVQENPKVQNRSIVAWDFLENSWLLLVDDTAQNAIQFSKSQGPFNPFQLQATIFILNKEGYSATNSNSVNYQNEQCPQPSYVSA